MLLFGLPPNSLSPPYPAWTDVGITELFEPEAVFEMSCVAVARNVDRQSTETAPHNG